MLSAERLREIAEKPDASRTPKETDDLYWWFYHEMEDPEEAQLKELARNHSMRWYGLLLNLFPTRENMNLLISQHGRNRPGRRALGSFFRKFLVEYYPLPEALLDLMEKSERRKLRSMAKILKGNPDPSEEELKKMLLSGKTRAERSFARIVLKSRKSKSEIQ